MQIVAKALEEPIRQIAANAGLDGSVILEKVRSSGKNGYGFDAYKEEYCDMIASGIVDPAKVTRSALENAASVSGMVLTTGARGRRKAQPAWRPAAPTRLQSRRGMGGMYYLRKVNCQGMKAGGARRCAAFAFYWGQVRLWVPYPCASFEVGPEQFEILDGGQEKENAYEKVFHKNQA